MDKLVYTIQFNKDWRGAGAAEERFPNEGAAEEGFPNEQAGENYSNGDTNDSFDEESICSWMTEPESLCNVWRGWKKQTSLTFPNKNSDISTLLELSAKFVASHFPFEVVESYPQPIPENIQLRIAFWSFPDDEEDIRLYSCLANGSADEFTKGEALCRLKAVRDPLQIGFHLSATVVAPNHLKQQDMFKVSVVFDRRKVSHCNCSCKQTWCQHVVALCLHRIYQAESVCLRAPVSETLSRLTREQLQKFAQYLINDLPRQVLPTAQKLLDDLLNSDHSQINATKGAPDPTAGPSASTHAVWCLEDHRLHDNIKKTLVKFCVPSPVVYGDPNCLTTNAPPATTEYQNLLRPLRGREPEGIWNLLSIVRELFKRQDSNSVHLLKILTNEMLQCEQLLLWWFQTKNSAAYLAQGPGRASFSGSAQNAASCLCDEIVNLWRLVILNPGLSPIERDDLSMQLRDWHTGTLERIRRAKCAGGSSSAASLKCIDVEYFPGFKPALEANQLTWKEYDPVSSYPGNGYTGDFLRPNNGLLVATNFHDDDMCKASPVTSHQVDKSQYSYAPNEGGSFVSHGLLPGDEQVAMVRNNASAGLSSRSSSSEGFCENEKEAKDWEKEVTSAEALASSLTLSESSSASSRAEVKVNEPTAKGASACEGGDSKKNDDYNIYYFDGTKDLSAYKPTNEEPDYFAGVNRVMDAEEIRFARAEALHAHGFTNEACALAASLAEELLNDTPTHNGKDHVVSFRMTILAKASFLCMVLLESSSYHHLAFRVGFLGLEAGRPPAANKALEVKLANQEAELINLLKKIPLGDAELSIICDRARNFRANCLMSRHEEAILPLSMATFFFESLCIPVIMPSAGMGPLSGRYGLAPSLATITAEERELGFEAAVAAIGLRTSIAEYDHPILCESLRRLRGELAVAMLLYYKDTQEKLDRILEKLLDKEVHQLFKASSLSSYMSSRSVPARPAAHPPSSDSPSNRPPSSGHAGHALLSRPGSTGVDPSAQSEAGPPVRSAGPPVRSAGSCRDAAGYSSSQSLSRSTPGGAVCASPGTEGSKGDSTGHGKGEENLESKLRRGIYKFNKKPSAGMAAVDSSAPETTSSDNSPTVRRRTFPKHLGPASDSGSSGKSSDTSNDCVEDRREEPAARPKDTEGSSVRYMPQSVFSKVYRPKAKSRLQPTRPNQPSEALAHYLFELAKTVLSKAGGTSATSTFNPHPRPDGATHASVPHRALHLSAFQIGLYALGIHNFVNPNWLSRTYSSHVSWIAGQAIEIGSPAINMLIDTWEGHLTPPEMASLADRAARVRDLGSVAAAAELALSCLPHAHALSPSEIQRALLQCKDQGRALLERACLAVESAAKDGGVYPEVLFDVARKWEDMHDATSTSSASNVFTSQAAAVVSMAQVTVPMATSGVATEPLQHVPTSGMGTWPVSRAVLEAPVAMPTIHQQYSHPAGVGPPSHPHVLGSMIRPTLTQPQIAYGAFVPCVPNYHPQNPMQVPSGTYVTTYSYSNALFQPMAGPPMTVPNTFHHASISYQHPPVMNVVSSAPGGAPPGGPPSGTPLHIAPPPAMMGEEAAPPPVLVPLPLQGGGASVNMADSTTYLHAAYRVGMLAIDTLGKRVHDDRAVNKYARNPPYRDNVKWLLGISMKLGHAFVQKFCQSAVNALISPFILQEIATEAALFLARYNPTHVQNVIRSPYLNFVMQRCVQLFIQCAHARIHHINPNDHDDFISMIVSARNAFFMVPGGSTQFQDMLQGLRRHKACKKDLWLKIMSSLSSSVVQ